MIRQATVIGYRQEWLHADHLTGHDLFPLLRHTRLRVTSWSMFPTIRKGDYIELDRAREVTAGDIVVYRQTGALVCHRVKALGQDGLIITGSDGVDRGTEAIAQRDIVGRVVSILRGRRRLSPTHAIPPTLFASLDRRLDRWRASFSILVRSIAMAIIAGLTSRPVTSRLLTGAFMSCLRFHLTARIPIESIPAYDMTHNSTWSRGTRHTRMRVREIGSGSQPLLHAYLGPYLVGSVDLRSGEHRVHPSICGLGLERYFSELLRHRFASQT